MNTEEIDFLNIEDRLYENELRQNLYFRRNMLGYESPLMGAILKLIRWNLILDDPEKFFEEGEKEILKPIPDLALLINRELLARWLDFSMLWTEVKNVQQVKMAVEAYMDIYAETKGKEYFLRALEVGRPYKGMFKARIEEFYETGNMIIRNNPYPFWQNRILEPLISFGTLNRCQQDFKQFFSDQHLEFLKDGRFSDARKTLKCLQTLKILGIEAYKIKCAEAYLAEGDSWLMKNPSGNYISLSDIYLKGFRKLYSVAGCDDLRSTLVKKMEDQHKIRNEILSHGGVNLLPKIDFEKLKMYWNLLGMNNFDKAFDALLNLPLISAKEVCELADDERKQGYYFNKMTNSVKLSNRGAEVGFLSGDHAIEHRIRMQLRETQLANIQALKFVMDVDGIRDIETIAQLMPQSSPFIQEERSRIFFKGLYAGFKHDFQTAAYILVPQFENAFKHLARNNEILVVRYHDKQQFDNTMGGCLDKIRPVLTEDLFMELQSFLTDTNQSNFRNELLHGITEAVMAQHFGKYVWWLALKMVFRPQELLKEEQSS